MANIDKELDQIKAAVYGKDVRQSIHDAIKAGNDEIESYTAAEQGRQDAETTRQTNETARQEAEAGREATNTEVKALIDGFVGDMLIANETTPGAVKSGGDITVAANGAVKVNSINGNDLSKPDARYASSASQKGAKNRTALIAFTQYVENETLYSVPFHFKMTKEITTVKITGARFTNGTAFSSTALSELKCTVADDYLYFYVANVEGVKSGLSNRSIFVDFTTD